MACDIIKELITDNTEHPYDFIFMDADMPIKNGYRACQEIREMTYNNEHFKNMKIIFCTGYDDEQEESKCI